MGWVTKYVTGKKGKAHSPKHSVCHRPLAVQAMGDISLSAVAMTAKIHMITFH